MASFEQNQQNQFNLNNNFDQVKQLTAEADRAAAAIGAAELEAEEELLDTRLKNLAKTQQTKLTQLGQILELEEKSIQELAKLKLTLSNRQFAVRKKEIQKELQLHKAAAEELFKLESKHSSLKLASASKKSSSAIDTTGIKAATKTKAADTAIQTASRKVQSAIYGVDKVRQDITEAIASIQETTQQVKVQQVPLKEQNPDDALAQKNTKAEEKEAALKFSANASLLDKIDLGHYSPEVVLSTFESLRSSMDDGIKGLLNQVTAGSASQDTTDFAGGLLKSYKDTIAAEEALNKLKKEGAEGELNRKLLIAETENKLRTSYFNKEAELRLAAIDAEARTNDLLNNKKQYQLNTQLSLENELAEKRNRSTENFIKAQEGIAFTAAHRDEILANERQQRELDYLDDYKKYLLAAGEYAISLEEYKANQERKRNTAAKKEATGGITDALRSGQLSKLFTAESQEARAKYLGQRTAELKESGLDESSAKLSAQFELLAEAAGGLQAALDADVKKIAEMQGFVDTRLQGSQVNEQKGQSYWKQLLKDAKSIAGASPFIKQEKLVDNIRALVDKGISFDVEQRAFLMTIQEKVANTFNAADGTLLRLIRIQQQDTTAGRLGMESALNSFLNSMYETSEYLEGVAANVRSSLEEMQALMEGAAGTEVEFQIQKWMGSLYSVGMSQNAVQDIAQAFGQIASGDISGLTGSGTGNLLIMAANEAGMSIADILQDGLDATETNKLMQAMVNYLAEIAESSSDSRVVQQQLANVYGVKASDLKAATNLASSIKDVSKQNLTYGGMLGQLEYMMNTIRHRTSVSEGITNMWDNVMYSMASTQASNPMLYMLPKMANLLRDVTGGNGISLPAIHVAGFGIDLKTSVADLMSVASMAGTALGALGPALTGISDLFDKSVGLSMLQRAGISTSGKAPVIARGSAPILQNLSGESISESGYIGNASGNDIKNATLQDAEDSKKKQMVQAKDEETADDVATQANTAVVNIYNLLEEVAHGSQSLRVRVINNNGGVVSFGGGEGQESPQTAPNLNNTDNGNWVLSF